MTKHLKKDDSNSTKPIVKKTKKSEEIEAFIFSIGKLKFALRKNDLYQLAVCSSSMIYYSSKKYTSGFSIIDADVITLIDLITILNFRTEVDKLNTSTKIIKIQYDDLYFGILINDDCFTDKIKPKSYQPKTTNRLIDKICTLNSEDVILIKEDVLLKKVKSLLKK